jgi:hypothetical protein
MNILTLEFLVIFHMIIMHISGGNLYTLCTFTYPINVTVSRANKRGFCRYIGPGSADQRRGL